MNFISVCSGIEAASVAWNPLGWKAAGFSEIEPFPCAVLAHHYPDVPNYGDLTKWKEWGIERGSVDLICGGTPCQSFSVAGLRKGLADPRGNLMLVFLGMVGCVRPRWVVWENVPGVLSSNGGRDFGTFLGALGKLGYGWSYRALDAQYVRVDGFGRAVPQRRRRVFVVGHLGDWQRAAAVLFERDCLSGNPAPRREAGKGFAPILEVGARTGVSTTDRRCGCGIGNDGDPMFTLQSGKQHGVIAPTIPSRNSAVGGLGTDFDCAGVAPSMTAGGAPFERTGNQRVEADALVCLMDQGGSVMTVEKDITGTLRRETKGQEPIIAIHDKATRHKGGGESRNGDGAGNGIGISATGEMYTLTSGDKHAVAIGIGGEDVGFSLRATPSHSGDKGDGGLNCSLAVTAMSVRRLTPVECERLMGFPDNYTAIPWRGKSAENCPDGPRYKALGNSWAVNCARWVGTRIQMVEEILK